MLRRVLSTIQIILFCVLAVLATILRSWQLYLAAALVYILPAVFFPLKEQGQEELADERDGRERAADRRDEYERARNARYLARWRRRRSRGR